MPPAEPALPLELGEEPGMAPLLLDEPAVPDFPVELGDDPVEPAVPDAPEVEAPPAPAPSRWPQPDTINALIKASAITDLEVLDIAFIFIPFKEI